MVGSHPLWGHLLWNAAIVAAEEIDAGRIDVKNKRYVNEVELQRFVDVDVTTVQ